MRVTGIVSYIMALKRASFRVVMVKFQFRVKHHVVYQTYIKRISKLMAGV